MKTSRVLLACLLFLTMGCPILGQPIDLQIDLSAIPIDMIPGNRSDAESRLRTLILGELKEPFRAWDWSPAAGVQPLSLTGVFFVDEAGKVCVQFVILERELFSAENKSFVVSTVVEVAPFTHNPTALATHLHKKLQRSLIAARPKWSEVLCAKVPVGRSPALGVHDPSNLSVRIPFMHADYGRSKFSVNALEPNKGEVGLETEGLGAVVNGQLTARINTWTTGAMTFTPAPGNALMVLPNLQDIRVYLRSRDPSTDPRFK